MGQAGVAGRAGTVTRADVIRAGRARFLRGERIDLVAIAEELGVARATVYRWHGDRDGVTGQVLLSLAEDTLDGVIAERSESGGAGVAGALVELIRRISGHPALRTYIAADPQRAMTLITGPGSVVAAGLAARFAALIERECPGAISADLSAGELGYAALRIGEAYCYSDVLAARELQVDRALPLLQRLLEPR